MITNGGLGLLVGTFIGSIIGSTGTMFVFKKLGKLEQKKLNEHEEEHVEEVRKYYQEKIREITSNVVDASKSIEYAEKNVKDITEEKPVVQAAPATEHRERLKYDTLDIHGGDKADTGFDYSRISRSKYLDVQKEYEREEPEIDEDRYPIQIKKSDYENPDAYVKEEVMYYEQNGIFADMEDNIIDHLTEAYFGNENLAKFGSQQASLDGKSGLFELYLRDEEIHTDYHIIYNGTEDFEHLGDCR